MNLIDLLDLKNHHSFISIAGGGGKTATLFNLGINLGMESVLLTTTTKILKPKRSRLYNVVDGSETTFFSTFNRYGGKCPLVFGLSSPSYPGKLTGVSLEFLSDAWKHFSHIIVEADGSAGRPLKAPAAHEPVIHSLTDLYIGAIGLDAIGKRADDSQVHRPDLFGKIRGKKPFEKIKTEDLVSLINHREGLFKNAPENCRRTILLNKADLIDIQEGKKICKIIKDALFFEADVILNSYKYKNSVLYSL